jgi:hypothetical protein
MNKSIRSLVVGVVMPLLVCCVVTYKHAQIPDSRLAEGEACFKACDGDRRDHVECVARCPGAETGGGPCTADQKVVCVDYSEHGLTSGWKDLITGTIIVAIVGSIVGSIVFVAWWAKQPFTPT